MKIKTYYIKRGDTLPKIAKELQISVEELREFHNRYCELDDLIGDKIPRRLERLVVPDVENKSAWGKKKATFSFGENSLYQIDLQNSFYLKNELMNENLTENIWQIDEDSVKNTVTIEVQDKKIKKYDSQLKELMDVISKINESTDKLQIQLKEDKTINYIHNAPEIKKHWEQIKFEELKLLQLEDSYMDALIGEYDKVFSDITPHISGNLLYQLLFFPKSRITYPVDYPRQLVADSKITSLIFPMCNLYYDLEYTAKEVKEKEEVHITVQSKKNTATSLLRLEEEYQKGYSQILDAPFGFDFTIEGKYIYNSGTGIFTKALVYVKEEISRQLFYIAKYSFTRIEK